MFRGLKGRRVVVTLTNGDTLRGSVLGRGWWLLRLGSIELQQPGGWEPIAGVLRIPRRSAFTLQEV